MIAFPWFSRLRNREKIGEAGPMEMIALQENGGRGAPA